MAKDFVTEVAKLVDGDLDKARRIVALFPERDINHGMTLRQQMVYNYLASDQPVLSLRQLAHEVGLKHPQQLANVLASMVIKGWLVPAELEEGEDEADA